MDSGGTDAAKPDSGSATDGGTPDTGTPVDAGAGSAPVVKAATAKQVGRLGTDLQVDLTASDADKDLDLVVVVLLDKGGAMLGTEQRLPINPEIKVVEAATKVTLPGVLEGVTELGSVKVSLIDKRGVGSDAPVTAAITAQPVLAAGAACDDTFASNRCAVGLGCKGSAAKTCSAGEAPTLKTVGYFDDDLGKRIVLEGTDPDGDVAKYTIRFLDAAGAQVLYDLDGDTSTPSLPSLTITPPEVSGLTDFYFRITPDDEFVKLVKKVGVTVSDVRASGNTSAELITDVIKNAPAKSSGGACSLRGFDYCKGNEANPLVCSASGTSLTAGTCKTVASARTAACTAALVLNSSGMTTVRGKLGQGSLWDTPSACSGAKNQPDAVVKFVLGANAAKVTLSTDDPYTAFNSEITLFKGTGTTPTSQTCGAIPAEQPATWCASDAYTDGTISGKQPTLVVENLEAGTYFVLVDSFPSFESTGDLFQLKLTVE